MASHRDDLALQLERNRSTRGSFSQFAGHREHVTRLLLAARAEIGPLAPRLLLLGAGNCNDIDLNRLLLAYEQIDLVDLDAAALAWGLEQQGGTADPRIAVHAPVDLRAPPWPLPTASVAASLCLLSQLIDALAQQNPLQRDTLGPRIEETVRSHLEQLVAATEPGGCSVLVTDFASSQTAPELATAREADLPSAVARLLGRGNFFQGLHPGGLHRLLTVDPWFSSRIDCHIPSSPWNWNVGNRVYAVSALVMRRKIAATGMKQA